jgi:hypothetical protein
MRVSLIISASDVASLFDKNYVFFNMYIHNAFKFNHQQNLGLSNLGGNIFTGISCSLLIILMVIKLKLSL